MQKRSVVCPSCQARYSLPSTVTAPTAKCRKCGAIMSLNGPPPQAKAPAAVPSGALTTRPRSRGVSRARAQQEPEGQQRRSSRSGRRTTGSGRRSAQPVGNLNKLYGGLCLVVLVLMVVLITQS